MGQTSLPLPPQRQYSGVVDVRLLSSLNEPTALRPRPAGLEKLRRYYGSVPRDWPIPQEVIYNLKKKNVLYTCLNIFINRSICKKILYHIGMEGIDRSRSQVAGITINLRSFLTNSEKSLIAEYDDLVKECGYAIRARPELYINLRRFLDRSNNDFKRILSLFGGAVSSYQITDIGFSHMIEFCIRTLLPSNDEQLKAVCFAVFQIHDPKTIWKGGALASFECACETLSEWIDEGDR